jgi:hypothetical protein
MKAFELRLRLIAPVFLLCCCVFFGSQVAQAQLPPPTFQTGDVFVGVTTQTGPVLGPGQVLWYRPNGTPTPTLIATLNTGQANTETAGMAFDAAGNLYATVFAANNVVKFDRNGNLQLGTFGSGYNFDPESIRFDSAGNAYVGQADGTHQILKFDSAGNSLAAFSPAVENRGTDWFDLAADQKTIFYTSEGTSIKRFDTTGEGAQLTDFATGLPGSSAYALRILPNGQVLVGDTDRVLLLDTSGHVVQTYCARQVVDVCFSTFSLEPGNSNPVIFALTLDPDGKSFWTADLVAGTVWKVDIATGAIDLTINTGFNVVGGVVVFHEITSSNSLNLQFSPSATPVTQIATIGNPSDPAAQSLALTVASVTNAINVSVSFFYEPTDISTGTHGIGIADGDCELGATEDTDFDCRLAGNFTYPNTIVPAGDRLVPHIIPSHNNLGVWVRVIATRVSDGMPAVEGVDYFGPIEWYYAWNSNPSLVGGDPPNPAYPPGWNNQNPQMYDRPGENVDIAFTTNITTYSKVCVTTCVGTADPGSGGKTGKLNDIVVGAPPNPPAGTADTVEPLVPVPGISPFIYIAGLPVLVSFELENESKEKSDPTALKKPHSVNVGTLDHNGNPIPVQFPAGFPTTFTYSSFFRAYFIFLSPAPYALSDGTPNTVYTVQIDSDLFTQPVNATFKVCTLAQVLNHTCP